MILGRAAIRLPVSSSCWQTFRARRNPLLAYDHADPVGRIDAGLITGLYAVRNPEKLSHMEQETTLRR